MIQNTYNGMRENVPGLVVKSLYSHTFPAYSPIEFGRFVVLKDDGSISTAAADILRTDSDLTGNVSLTIVKKDLVNKTEVSNSLTVNFNTDNNTTYNDIKTAIEALGNNDVELITVSSNVRGLKLIPDEDFEFYFTSIPAFMTADVSGQIIGVASLISNLESDKYERHDSAVILTKGAIYACVLDDYLLSDRLYLKLVGNSTQIGKLTKTKDNTTIGVDIFVLNYRKNENGLIVL